LLFENFIHTEGIVNKDACIEFRMWMKISFVLICL